MRILICEDDKKTLEYLEAVIHRHYGDLHQLLTFSSADELLCFDGEADILLSDIKLNNRNGIEICKELLKTHPDLKIIFITGYPTEYYEEIFEYFRPYGFIGKPVREELLFKIIDNITRITNCNQTVDFLFRGNKVAINPNNIIYIESHGRQKFVTTENKTIIINLSFDDIMDMLPKYFARCHNAFIINLNYISNYKNDSIVITNGLIIPIGRKYKQLFREKYFKYKENENNNEYIGLY